MASPEGRKGVVGPYVWLTITLGLVTILMALLLANLTLRSIAGGTKAGESLGGGEIFLPVIFLLFGATRSWKSLIEREPESDDHFGRKHRKFKIIAATCMASILLAGLGLGAFAGRRAQRGQRIKALLTQIAEINPKNTEFRQRLGVIRSTETPTMQDYHYQCLALESLLDEFEPVRQKNTALFDSLSEEARNSPQLLKTVSLVEQIRAKENEVLAALRREISKAKELISLPHNLREAFYVREIVPIQNEIERLAVEQATLLREAQKSGLTLPSDVADWVKE